MYVLPREPYLGPQGMVDESLGLSPVLPFIWDYAGWQLQSPLLPLSLLPLTFPVFSPSACPPALVPCTFLLDLTTYVPLYWT